MRVTCCHVMTGDAVMWSDFVVALLEDGEEEDDLEPIIVE